jgi:thiamine biosynthesis lipoprotein
VLISDGVTEAINWRMGISKPVSIAADGAGVLTVVDLHRTPFRAMATSGSAERGVHIWNPKAGGSAPASDFIQVSVIARDLVTADVWATAAFAEGERAIEHLNRINDLEALFVYPSGELASTEGFIKLLARPNPET